MWCNTGIVFIPWMSVSRLTGLCKKGDRKDKNRGCFAKIKAQDVLITDFRPACTVLYTFTQETSVSSQLPLDHNHRLPLKRNIR